uniref:Type IV pilus biogenesis n=1 Tax=Candidatus Kentrum sp. MB TaxID=2138164 RepID=A0A451B785_9GAMM|nr:MAG: Type IV pilus biogenesis [Candidatus Kentron sp. MB]VFK28887.1 MAG: Type IV pilus biogenesis [Candidatus Kentron sp. MB]VFK74136.1 MAG: Type IV pilus biogenesis [Candidatus Kentron sp. MB]
MLMLKTRHSKKVIHGALPILVSVPLLVGIGYTVMGSFDETFSVAPANHEEGRILKAKDAKRPSMIESTHPGEELAKLPLFGEVVRKAPVTPPPPVTVTLESTSNLVLHGIIKAFGEGESRAIIADARGKQDIYAAGSVLSKGIVLVAINDDHVVLDNNHRSEALHIWKKKKDTHGFKGAHGFEERESLPMSAPMGAPIDAAPDPMRYGAPPEEDGHYPRSYRRHRPPR